MEDTIVVVAAAADSAANQYLAPFAGAAIGEWFMDNGMDALIIYDDLSSRPSLPQVSLVLKRPSGREAYPGRVLSPQPFARTFGARRRKYGNGSLTALPIIETKPVTCRPTFRRT